MNFFSTKSAVSEEGIYAKAANIWIRSRKNACAHKLYGEWLTFWDTSFVIIQNISSIVPIILTGAIYALSSNQGETVLDSVTIRWLALISVILSGIALLASFFSSHFGFYEKKIIHKRISANYALIAQKVRRLDEPLSIGKEAAVYAIHHLEETFEAYKANGEDPKDVFYTKAEVIMKKLDGAPQFIKYCDKYNDQKKENNNQSQKGSVDPYIKNLLHALKSLFFALIGKRIIN